MHLKRACRVVKLWMFASALFLTLAGAASARPPCTAAPSPSGEWPSYGHDLANTRDQPDEHTIGTANVAGLKPAWVFATASAGDASSFETTPVVAGGCVFIGSTAGTVYALDAGTGRVVWKRKLDVPTPGLGGAIVGAARSAQARSSSWRTRRAGHTRSRSTARPAPCCGAARRS